MVLRPWDLDGVLMTAIYAKPRSIAKPRFSPEALRAGRQ